jgi:hypothetical protein
MKKLAALTLSLLLTTGTALADSPKDSPKDADAPAGAPSAAAKAAAKTNAQIAKELDDLRQTLQAQQEQLQALKQELAKRDQQIEEARKAAADANAKAADAGSRATDAANGASEAKSGEASLSNSVNDLRASSDALKASIAKEQEDAKKASEHGPLTIRYKGVSLTPGGFIAAETVNRQRAQSSDINTQFNGIPYPGAAIGKLTEMNLTGRQSRATLLFDAKVGAAKLTGYYEADFLGVGTASNNRQSNSYVFRQRQLWASAAFDSGFSVTGGQMWSLATENRKGIVNRAEWLPMVVDPQYVVGFTWQRAYGFRVTKNFGDKFAIAAAVEGPQATLTAHGNSTYTSAANAVNTNAFVFAPGNGAGLYNAFDSTGYSLNKTPEFIIKAALDPGWGHYEIFGLVSEFQNRIYPCAVVSLQAADVAKTTNATVTSSDGTVYTGTYNANVFATGSNPLVNAACTNTSPSAAGAFNDSRTGGGGGASFDVPLFNKKLDVGLKGVYGDGIGRFGSAQLADATMRPDGTLALIHGGHWLGRLELHPSPKLDIYGYVGGEYAARAAYSGFLSVSGKSATVPVTLTGTDVVTGLPVSTIYPETQTTWTTSMTGNGGYGYPGANNSGCSTEVAPGGTGAPAGTSNCNGDTRYIGEGTIGFWHKTYQGEKGRFQWGIQYSYFYKTGWSGSGGKANVGPHAVDNMVWTSFRYYLP